jgi:CheY-like chemotaxis protein
MRKLVLVLDSDEVLCDELRAILKGAGYQVISGKDGFKGKLLLETLEFDLVIQGLELAGHEELKLLEPIWERGLRTKVLALTGRFSTRSPAVSGNSSDGREGPGGRIPPRSYGVLSKPLNIKTLLEKVSELTSR